MENNMDKYSTTIVEIENKLHDVCLFLNKRKKSKGDYCIVTNTNYKNKITNFGIYPRNLNSDGIILHITPELFGISILSNKSGKLQEKYTFLQKIQNNKKITTLRYSDGTSISENSIISGDSYSPIAITEHSYNGKSFIDNSTRFKNGINFISTNDLLLAKKLSNPKTNKKYSNDLSQQLLQYCELLNSNYINDYLINFQENSIDFLKNVNTNSFNEDPER